VPFVLQMLGFERSNEQLLEIALADVGAKVAPIRVRPAFETGSVDLTRSANANLDHLELSAERAAGVQKPECFVRDFGPAVVVVRFGQVGGTDDVDLLRM